MSRPQNYCRACGRTWYPRGSNRSLHCPNCRSRRVGIVGEDEATTNSSSGFGRALWGCGGLFALGMFVCAVLFALCAGLFPDRKDTTPPNSKEIVDNRPTSKPIAPALIEQVPVNKSEPEPVPEPPKVPKIEAPALPPPKSASEIEREIYVAVIRIEQLAEEEALQMHPKPKTNDEPLVKLIKADMARQKHIATRVTERKKQLVEEYQKSLSDIDRIVRIGKAEGWPTGLPK